MATLTSIENRRYQGLVKSFKGSFGFIACADVAEKHNGRDAFLHRNVVNALPQVGCKISFRLTLDADGNPKAEDATLEAPDVEGEKPEALAMQSSVRRASILPMRDGSNGTELLVVRDNKEKGELRWSDLGGKVEPGESLLDCACRELAEEAEGYLSEGSISLLKRSLSEQFHDTEQKPEIVTLRGGSKPHAVAIFLLNCNSVDLELLSQVTPNAHGVHEIRWMSCMHPELRDRGQTRWPLLRAVCALYGGSVRSQKRSRSRSRLRNHKQPVTLRLMIAFQTPDVGEDTDCDEESLEEDNNQT
mmetsp:Transcript_16638/g.30241  ORF Transcript_16638/g.30241 Transcript_16638/m.30241 type:complete len:303 (-) Transcript_16638:19-927(-)